MMNTFGQPQLPDNLLHTMQHLIAGEPVYSPEKGGQYYSTPGTRQDFSGAIFPLSDDDWRKLPEGTWTYNSRKLYTNGYSLDMGGQIFDPESAAMYTVTGDLNHGRIHPMRRYVIEKIGEAAPQ